MTALTRQVDTVLMSCLEAKLGDSALIVCDNSPAAALVQPFRAGLTRFGCTVHVIDYDPWARIPVEEFATFASISLADHTPSLSPVLSAAMEAADVIVVLASDMQLLFAPGFRALAKDRRVLRLPYFSVDAAHRLLPGSPEEVAWLYQVATWAEGVMARATEGRIVSPVGTNLAFSFGQYPVFAHTGIAKRGKAVPLPAGQIGRVPDDRSVQGTIVLDGVMVGHRYAMVSEPITLEVRDGYVVDISGGAEAEQLARWLAGFAHPEVYHVTEIAFGLNPRCRLGTDGPPQEATHRAGTVSVALGCDVHLQGSVRAPIHADLSLAAATLTLGDTTVIRDGTVVLPEAFGLSPLAR